MKPPDLDAHAALLDLAPSAATPILLELARRQTAARRPADALAQHRDDRFVEPAAIDQRTAHRLDGLALDAAADFEALLLSPVAPLGACSTVAPTSQDRTLSTTRGNEVVSDPTNVLALESALRLRRDPKATVRLCTVHQVLRAQPLPPEPGFTRHFRMLALTSAGRSRASDGFEVQAFADHIRVFDDLLDRAAAAGCRFGRRWLTVRHHPDAETLADRVGAGLRAARPGIEVEREAFDAAYYDGLRVMTWVESAEGRPIPIGDTGRFDWLARLNGNRKLRFVASGFGVQLLGVLLGG